MLASDFVTARCIDQGLSSVETGKQAEIISRGNQKSIGTEKVSRFYDRFVLNSECGCHKRSILLTNGQPKGWREFGPRCYEKLMHLAY